MTGIFHTWISCETHNNPRRYAISLPFYRWRFREVKYSRSSSLVSGRIRVWSYLPTPIPLPSCVFSCVWEHKQTSHVLLITLILWISLKKPLCLASRLLPAPLTLQNMIPLHICIFAPWLKHLMSLYPAFIGRAYNSGFSNISSPLSCF